MAPGAVQTPSPAEHPRSGGQNRRPPVPAQLAAFREEAPARAHMRLPSAGNRKKNFDSHLPGAE